jgi:hypothetical protein
MLALRLRKGSAAAEPLFLRAISLLEKSPNRWELGVACLDAAAALPHRRAQLLERAQEIFTAIGAKAELRRVQRLEVEARENSRDRAHAALVMSFADSPGPAG